MEIRVDSSQLQQKFASFKPSEKIMAAIMGLALLGGGGYGLYVILPLLIALAENTIIFMVEAVTAVLLVAFVAMNWRSGYYYLQNIARRIRRAVVEDDPIGTIQSVINNWDKGLREIDEGIVEFNAAKKRRENSIKDTQTKASREEALAKAAEKEGRSQNEISQHAVASLRWSRAAEDMQPMFVTFTNVLSFLHQRRDLYDSNLQDAKNQLEVTKVNLDAAESGQKVVRRFKRLLGNNPDLERLQMAAEAVERKQTQAFAEMEEFQRVSKPVLDAASLERAADQMEAMEHFNAYIAGSDSKLLTEGDSSSVLQIPAKTGEPVAVERGGGKESRYLNMVDPPKGDRK